VISHKAAANEVELVLGSGHYRISAANPKGQP